MKRKSIVFLIPSLTAGGAERVVSTLANELIKKNEVKILQLYHCEPFYKLNNQIEINYCKETYNPNTNGIRSISNHLFMLRKISNIVSRETDILIGFTTTCNIYSVIISKLLNIPSIISERLNPQYSIENRFWEKARKYIYPKADKLVVQTQEIKRYFEPFVNKTKLIIIHNPIDPELSTKYNPNFNKESIILCVGRFDKQKNHQLLIKAFANTIYKDWKLLIVGQGKEKQNYLDLINDLNISESVLLIDKTSEIHNQYNRAKIFALTSDYEGFPNALIEAMRFGLPCVSSDCPTGPSDLIEQDFNGFLIPVNDQKALEIKLTELMQNKDLRLTLGKNAMASTLKFNVNDITKQWEALINDLTLK